MTVDVLVGDVRVCLGRLPSNSVDCVVTSPPYWGLRDYGVVGQLGMERTMVEHIAVIVEIFREIRRVLKPTGTVWLNYGDSYATSPNGRSAAKTKEVGKDDRAFRDKPFSTIGGVLKPKDLCMLPNRIAIALQEDGWWVRSEIIWHKPNPMPESIRDRPACAHEKIFLLTKSERYYYDAEAVREPRKSDEDANGFRGGSYTHDKAGPRTVRGNIRRSKETEVAARPPGSRPHTGLSKFERDNGRVYTSRNRRNVWTVATKPFKGSHFATFPPALIVPCIKAGCPEGGLVLDPFGGAGTTAIVAHRLNRNSMLIELNPDYADMAMQRICKDCGLRMQTPEAEVA